MQVDDVPTFTLWIHTHNRVSPQSVSMCKRLQITCYHVNCVHCMSPVVQWAADINLCTSPHGGITCVCVFVTLSEY